MNDVFYRVWVSDDRPQMILEDKSKCICTSWIVATAFFSGKRKHTKTTLSLLWVGYAYAWPEFRDYSTTKLWPLTLSTFYRYFSTQLYLHQIQCFLWKKGQLLKVFIEILRLFFTGWRVIFEGFFVCFHFLLV